MVEMNRWYRSNSNTTETFEDFTFTVQHLNDGKFRATLRTSQYDQLGNGWMYGNTPLEAIIARCQMEQAK